MQNMSVPYALCTGVERRMQSIFNLWIVRGLLWSINGIFLIELLAGLEQLAKDLS